MKEIKYKALVNAAMLGIVRSVMKDVSAGEAANFFITFSTRNTSLSDGLKKKYPREMSIILQNQFSDLQVSYEKFSVVLSFSGVEECITVPFSSILYFLDRECNFALEFHDLASEGSVDEVDFCNAGGAYVPGTNAKGEQQGKIIDITNMLKKK
ncbi:ClpXP protease specificity-enhancing factor SspB [Neorickettsia sennetsu]|nr:ClpXP protease specificity-enhancing factor SspB [Neorickettsia sennetsu]